MKGKEKGVASCELCGKKATLVRAQVEGVGMGVCVACAKFGRIVGHIPRSTPIAPPVSKPEPPLPNLVENYGARIRAAREKRSLKQEELARMIAERESIVQKMETAQFAPTVALAEKLERLLHITLIEPGEAGAEPLPKARAAHLTLGDMLVVRKRGEKE